MEENFAANIQQLLKKTEVVPKAIVMEMIVQMAKDLRLKVVVKGVETQEQLELLRAKNVEYIQG